jgi:hypothetical protein
VAREAARDEVAAYAAEAARRLHAILGDTLLAVYLTGSYALDDWEPATSDVDLLAISDGPIDDTAADAIVGALRPEALPSPGRELEFTLVTRQTASIPRRRPPLELNFDAAPERLRVHRARVRPDSHWLSLDAEVARRHGVAVLGPAAAELIAPQPDAWLREAQLAGLEWYARHEPGTHQQVLHACRAWAHGVDGQLLGKGRAAPWAIAHGGDRELIERALRIRRGAPPSPLPDEELRTLAERARLSLHG